MPAPIRIGSPSGLSFEFNLNGSIRRIDHGDIMINLFLGNEMEGGLTNIHLRRLDPLGAPVASIPLLGPGSPAAFEIGERGLLAEGRWGDIAFRVRLLLAEEAPAWFWHVELENHGAAEVICDLIHLQDVGLAHYGAIRMNEYYVSQYIDHTPLDDASKGWAVASRQNQSMGGRCPWSVIGSLRRGVAFATDALQVFGLSARAAELPVGLRSGLPGKRLQHEHSLVAIQDAPLTLSPGQKGRGGFFGWFEADKREATSLSDAKFIEAATALPEAASGDWSELSRQKRPASSLFSTAHPLQTLPLDAGELTALFGAERRCEERRGEELLSFFCHDCGHVVTRAKELLVLRPHGHLLRSGSALVPDEAALTSTAWMGGVFHSMVTQGHVSINRFLSTCHSYLSLFRSHGQRVFVEIGGRWHLLDVPSAFEAQPAQCRWIYKHEAGLIEVVAAASENAHELRLALLVRRGEPARFLISHHVAIDGDDGSVALPVHWEQRDDGFFVRASPDSDVGRRFPEGGFFIRPDAAAVERVGGDELLFPDGLSRSQPFFCLLTSPSRKTGLAIEGRLVEPGQIAKPQRLEPFWETLGATVRLCPPPSSPLANAAVHIKEIFPWFVQNALVHYLSPRGLEQYSGGGWGTRDVCQGPVELLLGLGRFEPIREILTRVFAQQNPDGDWPQWFMFFDRERNIRPGDSHGDIIYWPLVALARYLSATGDAAFLDERLPFFHLDKPSAESATVWQHVERALGLIRRRVIPGTRLAAYGHGDWNDSLQPAKPEMRERLCSSWTVTLTHQTLVSLADALDAIGETHRAPSLLSEAASVLEEFQRTLVADGVVAGLAFFNDHAEPDLLIHPRDQNTGLSFSLLPMIHAIIEEMFSADQAAAHLALIREHLLGPDGARLFDRPLAYSGGPQRLFQRAESASFFGREIGLMYTHAHLRFCEALARFGDAEGFFHALRQAVPIAVQEVIPTATLRQANCYFSSSDAAFADRYEAYQQYGKVRRGEVPLEGGWRVYSSGAGISVRLIAQCFLGVRLGVRDLTLDPVVPAALDGMKAIVHITDRPVEIEYRIAARGVGVRALTLNGETLPFARKSNRYRPGAAQLTIAAIAPRLLAQPNRLVIDLD